MESLKASDLDWTSLCPAGYFEPGQRTGVFRLGKDNLVANEKGESRISMEDYAIAMIDELESHAIPASAFQSGISILEITVRLTCLPARQGGGASSQSWWHKRC